MRSIKDRVAALEAALLPRMRQLHGCLIRLHMEDGSTATFEKDNWCMVYFGRP